MRRRPPSQRELDLRCRIGAVTGRVATLVHPWYDYVGVPNLPVRRTEARWGHGKASNPRLDRIIADGADVYATTLSTVASYEEDLARITLEDPLPGEPHWLNPWLPVLDGAVLYGLVRSLSPARYLEVGVGVSTLFADRARRDGNTGTTITAIDPHRGTWMADGACDDLIRQPLEATDLSVFAELAPGDIVFVDNSHHALANSDVCTFVFDVLPELAPGVIVGIHDVLLPDDYLPEWAEYLWSEQYVIAGLLMGGTDWWEPVLATWWASHHPAPAAIVAPLWSRLGLDPEQCWGSAFWFRTTGRFG